MQQLLLLKQKVDKDYKKLQRKYPMTKIVLKEINTLISLNASEKAINKWLKSHDNIIFSLEYNLKN